MTNTVINEDLKNILKEYFIENPMADLVPSYLFFIEKKFNIQPVLFPRDKIIFQSSQDAIKHLENENKLWHEAEIKITYSHEAVNENTKKIYICPFCGRVYGDNTHPNPQDAIYDHVSRCPENLERIGGLKSKRFFVSEDAEVIASYVPKDKPKQALKKVVYSSVLNGKLFNSKSAVIEDFKKNYLKSLSLNEVQGQNKFKIEESFLGLIQKHLVEDKIASFVEALAEFEDFESYVNTWVESE